MTQPATVKDVTEATFAVDVVEASRTRPVVVDFWATWCGPCHMLSPLLEEAAGRHVGEVDLVKVDVDQAPNLSRAFRIQGIPAVKAFRDGSVVAEFVGAQPAQVVNRFFAGLAPSRADQLTRAALAASDDTAREAGLRAALAEQADHPGAVVALARLLADRGDLEEAGGLLARVPGDAEARKLSAELQLRASSRSAEELADLERRAPGDADARLELAQALAAQGRYEQALPLLVEAVRNPDHRERARARTVEVFQLLGDNDPLVRTWRPKLTSALY
jgi:putative thioredoxin